jgi:hypothetical protein
MPGMRKLLLSLAGALFAVSTIGGVAFAKSPNANGPNNPNAHGPGQHGPGQHGPGDNGPGQHGPGQRGPDPTGHAKKGLCNAYSHNNANGKEHGQAFKNLAGAAAGANQSVAAFCGAA